LASEHERQMRRLQSDRAEEQESLMRRLERDLENQYPPLEHPRVHRN